MKTETEESVLLNKGPCGNCGSSDANGLYSDGHTHCYACSHHTQGDGPVEFTPRPFLRQRLDAATSAQVIVVSSPAGSGKTLMLADWVRSEFAECRRSLQEI